MNQLKRLASRLPPRWQHELKRFQYRRQILRNTFQAPEPDFRILHELVSAGDWVIDVGANVGHYTKRLSDLVGPAGRVIAIEPVPDTFALLAANVSLCSHANITLLNVAVSNRTAVAGMEIPRFESGLKNYYQAAVSSEPSALTVMMIALDSLPLSHRIRLIKIDAERHDPIVLEGAEALLTRDHPTLIVETVPAASVEWLARLGYSAERLPHSPNTLFR